MSKTVISLLIWLVCMPCMAAAETSKELEDALEKAKKEVSALFDANETEAYINSNRKLMELCLEANDEDLYYKTWSNLATFTFRQNAQKGLKVADEMRDYAKEHDSKIGIITALYTQANMSLKVGMDDRAVIIYTDGLNEAENSQQEQFGDERLLAALQRTTFENARQTINSLKQEVETFRGDAEPNDDLTMMCINVSWISLARSGSSIAIIVSPSTVAVCRYPLHRAPLSLLYYR